VSGWAIFLGVGAALATGQGVAHADDASAPGPNPSQPSKPHPLSDLKKKLTSPGSTAAKSPLAARSSTNSSSTVTPGTRLTSAAAVVTKQIDSIASSTLGGAQRSRSVQPNISAPVGGTSSTQASSTLTGISAVTRLELGNVVTRLTNPNPAPTPGPAPAPTDTVPANSLVPVAVGKWMLQESDGQISDWGGQPYGGKQLLEPVNVIILDPNSTTPEQSTAKLNRDMTLAGFPAQPIHSTGFESLLGNPTTAQPNGTYYSQQPADGTDEAFSDNLFIFPNDHARAFGPAPVPAAAGSGYVWTIAASTETPGIYNGALTHSYVSSDLARDILVLRLLLTGQATFVGVVPMGNEYNTEDETTGDSDGNAIVLQLK
jgi:hypothetical protein